MVLPFLKALMCVFQDPAEILGGDPEYLCMLFKLSKVVLCVKFVF